MELATVETKSENKISNLVEKAKDAEKSTVGIMEPQPPKRGRGRPPGAANKKSMSGPGAENRMHDGHVIGSSSASGPDAIPTRKIVEPFVKLISKGAGAYAGDKRAEMNHQELEDMAQALGMVCDKWMPVLSKDFGPEVLLATTFSAYGVRVYALKKVLEEERKALRNIPTPDPSKPLAESLNFPTGAPEMMNQGSPYMAQNLNL